MKIYLLCLLCVFSIFACADSKVTPVGLDGDWQLYKISYGFPPPNSPGFTLDVPQVRLSFDESSKKFKLYRENIVKEAGGFELSIDVKNPNGKDIIVFLTDNTFSNYSFPVDANELVLYQRTKVGGILADGSSFHYKRLIIN